MVSNALSMEGCCSKDCIDVINFTRRGTKSNTKRIKNGNKIFKKRKIRRIDL
jgi:hypothetical protein